MRQATTRIYIGLGSNIDRESSFLASVDALVSAFGTLSLSRVFESEAVGFDGDNFYNMVVAASTDKSLQQVCASLRAIEIALGRAPDAKKFSSRNADLDLLLFGDLVCDTPLVLPRQEITENAFVLWPLAELAGDLTHPGSADSYAALWQNYNKSAQQLWPVEFDWSKLPARIQKQLSIPK